MTTLSLASQLPYLGSSSGGGLIFAEWLPIPFKIVCPFEACYSQSKEVPSCVSSPPIGLRVVENTTSILSPLWFPLSSTIERLPAGLARTGWIQNACE